MAPSKDLVAASAIPLILSILQGGDTYGYALIQRVREISGGEMEWADGMLYPILHRLERHPGQASRSIRIGTKNIPGNRSLRLRSHCLPPARHPSQHSNQHEPRSQ